MHNISTPAKTLEIPGSTQRLHIGSVVAIRRFPGTRWIVNHGWYTYLGQKYKGWFFASIPAQTTLPVNRRDLIHITVESNQFGGPRPPHPEIQIPGNRPPWPRPRPPHLPPDGGDEGDCDCGLCDTCCECPPVATPVPPIWPPVPPKPPWPPIPPPPPQKPVKVVIPVPATRRYRKGILYPEGQLVFIIHGEIYQSTRRFRSSWRLPTVQENFEFDILQGNLAKASPMVGNAVTNVTVRPDGDDYKLITTVTDLGSGTSSERFEVLPFATIANLIETDRRVSANTLSIAENLHSIQQAVNEASNIVGTVNALIATNTSAIADVRAEQVKTNDQLQITNGNVSDLNAEVVKTNGQLQITNANVTALSEEQVKTNEALGVTNSNVSAINGELVNTNVQVNYAHERIGTLETDIRAEIQEAVRLGNIAIRDANTAITANKAAIETNAARIDANAEDILTNREDIQANAEAIRANEEKIAETEAALTAAVAQVSTSVRNIHNLISTNTDNIATNKADIAALRSATGNLSNRLDTLSDDLAAAQRRVLNLLNQKVDVDHLVALGSVVQSVRLEVNGTRILLATNMVSLVDGTVTTTPHRVELDLTSALQDIITRLDALEAVTPVDLISTDGNNVIGIGSDGKLTVLFPVVVEI